MSDADLELDAERAAGLGFQDGEQVTGLAESPLHLRRDVW